MKRFLRAVRRRRGAKHPDDGGFVLLESIVAISLIAVVMSALGVFFVGSIASMAQQRARQAAAQVATSSVETIRGLQDPIDVLKGRGSTAAAKQLSDTLADTSLSPSLKTLLLSMGPAASDTTALPTDGASALIPTKAVATTVNKTAYTVNDYLSWCVLSGGDCIVGTPGSYLHAVVAVTWHDAHCGGSGGTCTYFTSTLISTGTDPQFSLKQAPPPFPVVTPPGSQTSMVGDPSVSVQLVATLGVPIYTWQITAGSLPANLVISPGGLITGAPTTPVSLLSVTVQATDAFTHTSLPFTFTWTVLPRLTVAQPDHTSTINRLDTLTLASTGGNGSYTYSATGLPSTLTVVGNKILGTPTVLGVYPVVLTVKDSLNHTAMASFNWSVVPGPTVTSPGNQTTSVGATVNMVILSTCPNAPCTYVLTNKPTWLSISNGSFVGTPTATQVSSNLSVTITDADGATATSTPVFSWTVKAAPTITAPAAQTTTVGATVSLTPTSTCASTPCSYTLANGPSGLSVNSATGAITGTVTGTPQVYSVVETITDASGGSATAAFTWTTKAPPSVTSPGNQTSFIGASVNLAVTTSCPNSPCTYVLSGGPTGLSSNLNTGVITGTVGGTPQPYNTVKVTATDASGISVSSGIFTWTTSYPPLLATTPSNQTSTIAVAIAPLQLAASGGSGTYTWTGGATLPAGLTMTTAGRITGTPVTIAGYAVSLRVTDSAGNFVNISFNWAVVARATVSAPANQTTTLGGAVNLQLITTCPNAPCVYVPNLAPPGLAISSSGLITGTIGGTATTYSTASITVTDAEGVTTTSLPFSWKVNAVPVVANPGTQQIGINAADTLDASTLVTGGTGPYTYSATGLPSWLSLNSTTGMISGTSPGTRLVTSGITISVVDSSGVSATSAPFKWIVTNLSVAIPNLVTQVFTTANVDLDKYVTGGSGTNATITIANPPSWSAYNTTTHVVSGTPFATGTTSNITVTVTDSDGAVITSAPFTWKVINGTSLVWSTIADRSSLPNAAATALDVKPLATNDVAPYAATGLPPGLTMNTVTGIISGTPTVPGSYRVTASATDSNAVSVPSAPFTWTVTSLAWTTIPAKSSVLNTAASLDITPYDTGGVTPYSYTAAGLPPGVSINASTGVISGSATARGTYSVTVTNTDATGASVTSTAFTWTVT